MEKAAKTPPNRGYIAAILSTSLISPQAKVALGHYLDETVKLNNKEII
jgi:hypothetical protein